MDLFYVPDGNGILKLGMRMLDEFDDENSVRPNKRQYDALDADTRGVEQVVNGFLESLSLPREVASGIVFKMELIDKTKATQLLVSDSHRRGTMDHGAILTDIPTEAFFAPDATTSICGPLTFLWKSVYFDQYNFIKGLGGSFEDIVDWVNTRVNMIPGNQVNLLWLLPNRQSATLMERAFSGLVDMIIARNLTAPKVQRMLKG